MNKYLNEQLDLPESHPHYSKACYVRKHGLSLIDYDWWVHITELIGFDISFDDYRKVDGAIDGDLLELTEDDVPRIRKILDKQTDGAKVWTVSIKDREDAEMEIWTTTFSTEEAADKFKTAAEEKLKSYGVYETVDVIKDAGMIDDDMYLDWIDDRYGDE